MVTNSIGHFRGPYKWYIVLDSTNKTTSFKFPLVFRGGLKIPWKNSSNRNATWYKWVLVTCWASTNTHLYHVALRFDEFFHRFYNKNECPIHFTIFSNPIQWNWSWIFYYFLKNFWAFLWLESKTMVFVRSSKVTNGWLVTIRDTYPNVSRCILLYLSVSGSRDH